MISVSKALSIITNSTVSVNSKSIDLQYANKCILSKNINSPIHMPPFRQSAMDGYAIALNNSNSYTIIGEVKAGDTTNYQLQPGQGVRIFTGARVPDSSDTVVIQENVTVSNHTITINNTIKKGSNIRQLGEQIKKEELALSKGTKLTPAAIGFLAGLGIKKVDVYIPPKIAIITTGNELIKPGQKLTEGKIYESNSIQLETALKELNCSEIKKYNVVDDYELTKNCIKQAININDIVLISGGISVGDYDFVKEALHQLETEELFYKIKQKPGKPLYYGINHDTHVFALPGNPASSLTCFYIYVLPILKKLMGYEQIELNKVSKIISSDFVKKGNRAQFLKAKVTDKMVTVLEGQSSSMLYTYAIANSLVYIPEEIMSVQKGDSVEVILLPSS